MSIGTWFSCRFSNPFVCSVFFCNCFLYTKHYYCFFHCILFCSVYSEFWLRWKIHKRSYFVIVVVVSFTVALYEHRCCCLWWVGLVWLLKSPSESILSLANIWNVQCDCMCVCMWLWFKALGAAVWNNPLVMLLKWAWCFSLPIPVVILRFGMI